MTHVPCATCATTERLGYNPSNKSHCEKCHRSWRGHAEGHCDACCRHFGGDTAFQAHIADGVCRDPSVLKTRAGKPRFRPIERVDGIVWVKAESAYGDGNRLASKKVPKRSGSRGGSKRSVACVTRNEWRIGATIV
jgi:hypothetical protein